MGAVAGKRQRERFAARGRGRQCQRTACNVAADLQRIGAGHLVFINPIGDFKRFGKNKFIEFTIVAGLKLCDAAGLAVKLIGAALEPAFGKGFETLIGELRPEVIGLGSFGSDEHCEVGGTAGWCPGSKIL